MEKIQKVALITGSNRGIGKAVAMQLARCGYRIVIHYFKGEQEAMNVADEIKTCFSVDVIMIKADLKKEIDIHKMVEKVMEKFGQIDVLVHNAAMEINSDFWDKTVDDLKLTFDVNVFGPFLLSKIVGKIMMENKKGKMIFITSNNAIDQNDPITLEYDASKAALHSMIKNLAIQFAPLITVNGVAPGWISTEKVEKINQELQGKFVEEESKRILLKRFGEPEEVARVVSFLVSEESSYINGEIIRVDGGVRNV